MFFKNLFRYSASSLLVQAAQLVQGLVVRRLLSPASLGIWNYVGVTQNFVGTFDLGISPAAARELPLLHGAGRRDTEDVVRATAFWGRLAQGMLFAAGILVFSALTGEIWRAWDIALTAAALVVFASVIESFTTFCQATERYTALSRNFAVTAIFTAVLMPLGGWLGGSRGLMLAAAVTAAGQCILFLSSAAAEGIGIGVEWNWPAFRRLLAYGLPMRGVDYPLALLATLDVVVVSRTMAAANLAIYATAKLAATMSVDIPTRMGTVYLSRLYIRSGQGNNRQRLGGELARFLFGQYFVVIPAVVFATWWFVHVVIIFFLPRYQAALPLTPVLLATVFFLPQTSLVRNFWMIDKRYLALGLSNVCGLAAMGAALAIAFRWKRLSMPAVAWSALAGYVGLYGVHMMSIGRRIWGPGRALAIAAAAGGAALYSVGVIWAVTRTAPETVGKFGPRAAFIPLLEGVLLLLPLLALGVWKTGLKSLWRSRAPGTFRGVFR